MTSHLIFFITPTHSHLDPPAIFFPILSICFALFSCLPLSDHSDAPHALQISTNPHLKTPHQNDDSAVQYALQIVKAVRTGDTKTFFRLYTQSPHLSGYLLDFLVSKMRILAYGMFLRSNHTLPLVHLQSELGFDTSKVTPLPSQTYICNTLLHTFDDLTYILPSLKQNPNLFAFTFSPPPLIFQS